MDWRRETSITKSHPSSSTMDSRSGMTAHKSSTESENDLPPPSYIDSVSQTTDNLNHHDAHNPFTAQIAFQLSTLTSSILAIRAQTSLLSTINDQSILSHLTPHIQIYLSDFSSTGLSLGSLILVPAYDLRDVVSEAALPTDYDFRNPDEFDRIVRVSGAEKSDSNTAGHAGASSERKWFWKDEAMAKRLAECLQPAASPSTPSSTSSKRFPTTSSHPASTPSQIPLAPYPSPPAKAETRPSFWWSRKKNTSSKSSSLSQPSSAYPPSQHPSRSEKEIPAITKSASKPDGGAESAIGEVTAGQTPVSMTISAQEIVFRTENDFGILGTERGWAIVVQLKVHLARP